LNTTGLPSVAVAVIDATVGAGHLSVMVPVAEAVLVMVNVHLILQ
jgi:hypothetical protein